MKKEKWCDECCQYHFAVADFPVNAIRDCEVKVVFVRLCDNCTRYLSREELREKTHAIAARGGGIDAVFE